MGEGLTSDDGTSGAQNTHLVLIIEAKGSLAALQLDGVAAADLERTERLLRLLVSSAPKVLPKRTKGKRKPKAGSAATNPV